MSQEPDFYNKHSLSEYDLLQAIDIVKGLVKPELAKYITEDIVKPVWQDGTKRTWRLKTLGNFFNNRASARKKIEDMESWIGVVVGSRDIKSRNMAMEDIKGQNYLIVTDEDGTKAFGGWGTRLGPSGSEVEAPLLERASVRIAKRVKGERTYWDGKYVSSSMEIPMTELKSFLRERAWTLDMLAPDMKYQQVLLRGKVGVIMPLENWIESDEAEEEKDSNGNIIYQRDEKDPSKLKQDQAGNPIPKWRFKRKTDGIGQNLLQTKDRSNTVQYVFKVSLYEDGVEDNRVSIQFQHTKFGEHFTLMQDADLVMQDAGAMPIGGSEDGFTTLTDLWGNKEVIIAGTIISVNQAQDGKTYWYGIDGVLMLDNTDEVVITPTTPVEQPAQPVVPTIVAETAPPVGVEPIVTAPEPKPVVEEVAPPTAAPKAPLPPQPTPAAPLEPVAPVSATPPVAAPDPFALLKRGINTIFDTLGENISYEMLMSLKQQIPTQFHILEQRPVIEAFMESVRADRNETKTAEVVSAPQAVVEEAPGLIVTPAETVIEPKIVPEPDFVADKEALAEHPAVATISPSEILAQTKAPPVTPVEEDLVPCKNCGKLLGPQDMISHYCEQP